MTTEKISIEAAAEVASLLQMKEELFPTFFQAIQKAEYFLVPGTCCRVLNHSDATRDLIAVKQFDCEIVILFFGSPIELQNFSMYRNPLAIDKDSALPGINVSKYIH